jgi:prophage regulatory protein
VSESLIRLPALRTKLGLSRSTIYRLVDSGKFPAPIKLSPQTIAWVESEVETWLEARRKDRPTPA